MKIAYFVSKKGFYAHQSASYIIPKLASRHHNIIIIDHDDLNKVKAGGVLSSLAEFDPDIIHFFWSRNWLGFIGLLSAVKKAPKIVVDFRSPILLSTFNQQKKRTLHYNRLDGIVHGFMTTALPVIKNNLGVLPKNSFEYFVGVPKHFSKVSQLQPKLNRANTLRLVIVSTLHAKRKIGQLIWYCTLANILFRTKITLDIIGTGENFISLKMLAKFVSFFCDIRLLGLLENKIIAETLPTYDAGITHLPLKIYTDAPALKTFEYCNAGIAVIASQTNYHKRLCDEGFNLVLYRNSFLSFARGIKVVSKVSAEQLYSNRQKVSMYEWENIFTNFIEPAYEKIIATRDPISFDSADWGWRDRIYRRCSDVLGQLLRLSQ